MRDQAFSEGCEARTRRFPCMNMGRAMTDKRRWLRLVKSKLVPGKLLIPAGMGIHEWSRAYRNLIFEMAEYVNINGGMASLELARRFSREHDSEILHQFSEAEIYLLMAKSMEYELS